MIVIDGSYGEGGGQILRTSLILSSLTKIPIKLINIRKNRSPPGLKSQHLHSVLLIKKITRAETSEISIGSLELYFSPKGIYGGIYKEDIGTAGSITLLLQGVLLTTLFSDSKIKLIIKGGTDVKHSPSLDYFRYILLPYYRLFANIDFKLIKRGFYPKGGGEVEIEVNPIFSLNNYTSFNDFLRDIKNLGSLDIDFEMPKEINIYSVASKDLKERKVCERMVKGAISVFKNLVDIKIRKHIEYVDSYSTGAVITIVGNRKYPFGTDLLGEKNLRAEVVGKLAAEKFIEILKNKASVDENLSDNLIPFISLIGGKFTVSNISNHLKTNIWVVKQFLNIDIKIDKIGNLFLISFK
ncbi:MAG: RNA 3'-terminal phosphate cyclase [Candidatus Aenigmatarchaeota archaeon]